MTLPAFDYVVFPVEPEPPRYKVGPHCSNPTCRRFADHAHHIVRRSALGGDYAWITLEDDSVVGNLTALCAYCHEDVTGTVGGHKAAIRYDDGLFVWCRVAEHHGVIDYVPLGALRPQPPTPNSLIGSTPKDDEPESELCPTCGHATRKRARSGAAPGPRRPRKSWSVSVPADEENGAEVLDVLVDDLAEALGLDDPKSALRRYHVLVPALYWVQQNKTQFLNDLELAS